MIKISSITDFLKYYCNLHLQHGRRNVLKDGKIDISDKGISYWSRTFNCSEKNLREAVNKIGTIHNVLLLYLQMNHLIDDDALHLSKQ